jgi:hypothetical protein
VLRLALLVLMVLAMTRLARLEIESSLILLVVVLAWAPLHTGFATGNVSIVAVPLAVVGVWATEGDRWIFGSVLLGLAACLKPQIGICFLLYYLIRGRWRIVAATSLIVLCVIGIGAVRLHALGLGWVSDFIRNGHVFLTADRADDFASSDPMRFTLISLQVPAYELTRSRLTSNGVALGLGFVMSCGWLALMWKMRRSSVPLLEIGTLSVISLFAVYHRFYDAILLLLPLAWTLTDEARKWPKVRWSTWILCIPFLVPGAPLLQTLLIRGRLPVRLGESTIWNAFVISHESWCLLALGIVLLSAMALRLQDAAQAPSMSPGKDAVLSASTP